MRVCCTIQSLVITQKMTSEAHIYAQQLSTTRSILFILRWPPALVHTLNTYIQMQAEVF